MPMLVQHFAFTIKKKDKSSNGQDFDPVRGTFLEIFPGRGRSAKGPGSWFGLTGSGWGVCFGGSIGFFWGWCLGRGWGWSKGW